jgi:Low psii accumulation1 / Rep27
MDSWTPERIAEKRAQMRAGLASPLRPIRLLLYVCFTGAGIIGTLVFFSRALGGFVRGNPSLGVQELLMMLLHIVLAVTMVVLFRAERSQEARQAAKFLKK